MKALTAKPPASDNRRLCLRPPYLPFSWTAALGCRNRAVKCCGLHLRPTLKEERDATIPTEEAYHRASALTAGVANIVSEELPGPLVAPGNRQL